jgi:hypothetical protein
MLRHGARHLLSPTVTACIRLGRHIEDLAVIDLRNFP